MSRLTADLPVFGELEGTRTGNQWHLLRATWAVNCARRGGTVWQLMSWGGWTNPQTVMRNEEDYPAACLAKDYSSDNKDPFNI